MYTQDLHATLSFYQWTMSDGTIIAAPRLVPRTRVLDANETYGLVECGIMKNPYQAPPSVVDLSQRWVSWTGQQMQEIIASPADVRPVRIIDNLSYRRLIPTRRLAVSEVSRPDAAARILPPTRIPTKKGFLFQFGNTETVQKYGFAPPDQRIIITSDALASLIVGFPGSTPGERETNPNITDFLAALQQGRLIEREAPVRAPARTNVVDVELAKELGIAEEGDSDVPF